VTTALRERPHGLTRYKAGCPCEVCARAGTRSVKQWRYNRLQPGYQPWVDAALVRTHLQELVEQRMGAKCIAAASGVSEGTVSRLLWGDKGRTVPRVRSQTARRLLAVRFDLDALAEGALVEATLTRRRLQALVACGRSIAELARALDMGASNLTRVFRAEQVTAGLARRVRALYRRWWDVPPPQSTGYQRARVRKAKAMAAQRGWTVADAWEDDDPEEPDESVDEVAVASALRGERRLSQLNAAERRSVALEVRRQGGGVARFADLMRCNGATARAIMDTCGNDLREGVAG
jgi:hypothetical protein